MTKTWKPGLGLAVAALLSTTVSACSGGASDGSSGADYCSTLKSAQSQLGSVDFQTVTDAQWNQRLLQFEKLQGIAPAVVKDDWTTTISYFKQFNSLLDKAGLTVEDIKTLQNGQLPPGVDKAEVTAIVPAMQKLQTSSDLPGAQQAIRDNAKSQCHITLGTPSPTQP